MYSEKWIDELSQPSTTSPEQILKNYNALGITIGIHKKFDYERNFYRYIAITQSSFLVPCNAYFEIDIRELKNATVCDQSSPETAILELDKLLKTSAQNGHVLLVPSDEGYFVHKPTGEGRTNLINLGPIPLNGLEMEPS